VKGKLMKSKERHELKGNELAEWFAGLPEWFSQNRNKVIYIAAILIILGIALFWYRYQKNVIEPARYENFTEQLVKLPMYKPGIVQSNLQGKDETAYLRDLDTKLQDSFSAIKNVRTEAIGYIEQAQILRTEIHYRAAIPDKSQLTEQINKAKQAYNNALQVLAGSGSQDSSVVTMLEAMANYGLGLCEEELGNFDEAIKKYKQITEKPAYQYTIASAEAKQRLAVISDFEKPVAFKPMPVISSLTLPFDMNRPLSATDVNLMRELKALIDRNSPNSPVIQQK
jgi:tetratricopeptide (TPR) repeat protein